MAQLIYSFLALSVTVLFSTSLNRTFHGGAQRTYTNEVLTQMIGVGQDVLEDVGRRSLPFDEAVDEDRYAGRIEYPLVHAAFELTPDSSFGGCTVFASCLDLDDFHGMTLDRQVGDLDFEAAITVQYVDESDPATVSTSQTFAKKVTVAVSSTAIAVGGSPLTATYSRVFAYERTTDDPVSTP